MTHAVSLPAPRRRARLVASLLAAATIAVAGPLHAQEPPPAPSGNVRVEAHVVFLDRARAERVGLRYVQVGNGRVLVEGGDRRGRGDVTVGAAGEVAGIPVRAFVDVARRHRVLQGETRSQVVVASGAVGSVSSGTVQVGGWGATRTQGPELLVSPRLLADGRIQLAVRVRERDEIVGPFGHGADGSPVRTATTVVVRPGEEATIGTLRTSVEREDVGLLRWGREEGERDVLVVVRATVVP